MARLKLIALLLTLSVSMVGQEQLMTMREYIPPHKQTAWEKWSRPVGIIAYHIGSVALGAIADGQFDEGNKNLAHALQAAEVASLIGGPFIFDIQRNEWFTYIATYGFMRFSFFDSFYNMTRDLPVLFNGTTSNYDRFMNTIPEHGKAWCKSWSLIVGISIPIKYL